MVEPEREIWIPVQQKWFVKQASFTNNTMVFSFYRPNLSGDGTGAKKFRCLELEPEPEIYVPTP